jgi:4-hydroxy-tetrahydrodipicolinate reductase
LPDLRDCYAMRILVLGRGKTGSLVADVARERGHEVGVVCAADNPGGAALSSDKIRNIDLAIDFTTPAAVLDNIQACALAGKNLVVGTTGWYGDLGRVKQMVEHRGIGLLYAANFSVGVNLFLDIAQTAATALQHHYHGQIFERHHAQKKDAPSGTAVAIQNVIRTASGTDLEIVSFREGDVVGMHELVLQSPLDTIYLCHDSKSRRGFAEGAVRAAEWLVGKKGLFEFRQVWRELT